MVDNVRSFIDTIKDWFSTIHVKIIEIYNYVDNYLCNLNPEYVYWTAIYFMVITLILATIVISKVLRSEQLRELGDKANEKGREYLVKNMQASSVRSFNYDEIKAYIDASGLSYMTNYKITPLGYVGARIAFSLLVFIFLLRFGIIPGLIGLVIGFYALDFIINLSDKSDNEKMLSDIEDIYDTLRIQTKAGVYITSVLTDCYLVVKNKRLKSAFLKLTGDIAAKNDIVESLDEFRAKFRNEYIDTLVIIIKQSMQTGQAAKMFDDIREQIADIDAALVISEKNNINRYIIAVQLIIYSAIIIVAVYVSYISLASGINM